MADKSPPQMDPNLQNVMRAQAVHSMMRLDVAKHLYSTLLTELLLSQGATVNQIASSGDQLAPLAWALADGFLASGQLSAADLKGRLAPGPTGAVQT